MEDIQEISFPQKPQDESAQPYIGRSIISIIIFIGAFYLIFKWEITYVLILACVILIHELGHYVAMRIFKYKDLSIFFVPLVGAFASGSKERISQRQDVIILLAGPVPGIIIGVVLYYFGLRDQSEFLIRTSNILILINLFNLLPIMPLDGGRVIKSLFFESSQIINMIFIFLSIAVLVYISISSESYFLLIIPFFLVMQLSNQSQAKKVKQSLKEKGIDTDKSWDELSDRDYWLIRGEIISHSKLYSRDISPDEYNVSEKEAQIIKLVKNIIRKKPEKDLGIGGKILITFFWLLMFIVPMVIIALYYIRLGLIK
jgi:stage IV sporulation protein FB